MRRLFIALVGLLLLINSLTVAIAADNTKTVTVGTTATQIVALNPAGRRGLILYNNGSVTVFLGFSSTDCDTDSLPLLPGSYVIYIEKSDSIYGIVASGTCDIRVWEDER